MRDQKWSLGQMNTVMGEWALHNVHWDYTDPDGRDQGRSIAATMAPMKRAMVSGLRA
jgi:hypothetical protein